MSTVNAVFVGNLGTEFDLGTIEASKIRVKIDGTLVKNPDGSIGLNGGAITVVSPDVGNIIVAGANGGAYLDSTTIQNLETVWTGSESDGFLTVTPGGTKGHDVVYGFDWTNTAFVEAVQDAIGSAALAGAGIVYDDVANAISTSLGNIAFNDGLIYNATNDTVAVLPDPASPNTVTVSPSGVSVAQTVSTDANNIAKLGTDNKLMVDSADIEALATVDVCDAFGVSMFDAL